MRIKWEKIRRKMTNHHVAYSSIYVFTFICFENDGFFCFWPNCNSRNWLCADQIRRVEEFFLDWFVFPRSWTVILCFFFKLKTFEPIDLRQFISSKNDCVWAFENEAQKSTASEEPLRWSWMKCKNVMTLTRNTFTMHTIAYCSLNVISSKRHRIDNPKLSFQSILFPPVEQKKIE